MPERTVLSDEAASRVRGGVDRAAKALRDASLPFVAAQLQPTLPVSDRAGLSALKTRVEVVERFLRLRPAAKRQQRMIEHAIKVLKQRVEDVKENS